MLLIHPNHFFFFTSFFPSSFLELDNLASLRSFNPVTSSVNFLNFSNSSAKTHRVFERGITN